MKILIWKDTRSPMFIAALCTISKTQKKPQCPSIDEWIKKIWLYIYGIWVYTHIYHIQNDFFCIWDIKKEWNNAICSNMDGPRDYHSKWSKSNMLSLICVITYLQSRDRLTDIENKLMRNSLAILELGPPHTHPFTAKGVGSIHG